MSTLKLDTTGDLAVEDNGLVLLDDLADETAQRLLTKFRFFKGEWSFDDQVGVPWYDVVIGVKNPSLPAIRALLRQIILGDEGIEALGSLTIDFDSTTRSLSASFEATLVDGTPMSFADLILGTTA